ncbi:MAG: hypothetical protein ACRC33_28000 [Gemmataceae bacterium]
MTAILLRFAAAVFALQLATYAVGWASALLHSRHNPADSTFLVHVWLGMLTNIATLAVHCLIFIYFLGTGRWVKEVALAYQIPDEPLPKLTRELKRKSFPPALFAMLIVIAASAAGAGVQTAGWWWGWHAVSATAALAVNLWAFWVEVRCVSINGGVIDRVMAEVDRIRAAAGLPTNADALKQMEAENDALTPR